MVRKVFNMFADWLRKKEPSDVQPLTNSSEQGRATKAIERAERLRQRAEELGVAVSGFDEEGDEHEPN